MTGGQKPIRVLTVDDHALLRNGIRRLIGAESDMQLVAEASTGREALEEFRTHRPDVTLMDLQMPDMTGLKPSSPFAANSRRPESSCFRPIPATYRWSAP